MEDELNRGLPSDRFEAEWWLDQPKPAAPTGQPAVLLRVAGDGEPIREAIELATVAAVLIAVPEDFQAIKKQSLERAQHWRLESRAALEATLNAGMIAVDFLREGAYVMARTS
jgi:predicted GNAT superfamily acetyltransferase